jgi:bloom syndrome protein
MMDRYLVQPAQSKPKNSKSHDQSYADPLSLGLRRVFGFNQFRVDQRDICEAVLDNQDLFVVMPTGGGKTLCYALPAILSSGVTIVISPLISLIEDQVSMLIQLPSGGIPAAYLTSTCSTSMVHDILQDLTRTDRGEAPYLKLLYITPERLLASLLNKDFIHKLYQNEFLARFVIDEAHCISSWGHDFRKDYCKLGQLKETFPDVPIICLTATASKKVEDDCVKILGISKCRRINSGT